MRWRKLILITLAYTLVFLSCKKSEIETIRIKGHITNSPTTQAIEGAVVTLQSAVLEGGVFHNSFEDIETTVTDASGFYSFETETKKAVKYRIEVGAENYFSTSADFNPFDVTREEDYIADFSILPVSWFHLDISNINPWDQDDKITWSFIGSFTPCNDCCNSSISKGEGPLFTFSGTCRIPGEQWLELTWAVTKNLNTVSHSDSVWIASFDTISYNIQY